MVPFQVLYPSKRSTIISADSSFYAGLDYDSKEEFNVFCNQLRIIICENFRQATFIAPLVTYSYVERWLQQRIQHSLADSTPLTPTSFSYLEWAAVACVSIINLNFYLEINLYSCI